MAAGMGTRLAPLTESVPKPLVRVQGQRMIDSVIQAGLSSGIEDIVIVRGYKARMFDVLLDDYPMVRFVENDRYASANNIYSMLLVADLIGNSYVAEADLVLSNPRLLASRQSYSNYLGVPCEHTDDWAFETRDEGGLRRITRLLPHGGDGVAHMFGISYWTPEDARLLRPELESAFNSAHGNELYFEQVALDRYACNHRVYVRECSFDDIREIDTYDELCGADPSYLP